MHREWIDRSAHGDGALQRWDPRLKVGISLATLLIIALGSRDPDAVSVLRLGGIALVLSAVAGYGGIPWKSLLLRSLVVLPFVGFVAAARAIQIVHGSAGGLHLGEWTVGLAPDGIEAALLIIGRAWVSVGVTLVLVLTTPLPAILSALDRCHVPRGFLETCSLVYRYLWVLLDEGGRLLLARRLRGGPVAPWRSGGAMLATLFVRSLDRGHRIEVALRLRGYQGTLPIGRDLNWTRSDSARLLIAAGVLVAVWLAAGLVSGGTGT